MSDIKVLALVGSLRAASVNRQIAELAVEVGSRRGAPARCSTGWGSCRSTTRTSTTRTCAASRRGAARGGGRRGRGPGGHPGVQRQHSRRAQERDRLAVAPVRQQRAQGQADGGHRRVVRPVRRGVGARRDPQVLRDRRARVVERSSCRCRKTVFDGKHPRENAEVAANVRDVVGKLAAEVCVEPFQASRRPGPLETRRRLCCCVTVTVRRRRACRWPVVDLSMNCDTPDM